MRGNDNTLAATTLALAELVKAGLRGIGARERELVRAALDGGALVELEGRPGSDGEEVCVQVAVIPPQGAGEELVFKVDVQGGER